MIVKFSFCVTRNENRNLYSFNLLLKTGNLLLICLLIYPYLKLIVICFFLS